MFAGKHGFITLRDLFRWSERYRLEEQNDSSRDWLQHLADDGNFCFIVLYFKILYINGTINKTNFLLSGYMLLAGRVRKPEEALIIQNILEKHFKRTVNPDALFSEAQVTSQFSEFISTNTTQTQL